MPETYSVEPATADDLENLAALRLAQAWHANRFLLDALLDWEQARIFVVRERGDGGIAPWSSRRRWRSRAATSALSAT